MRSRPARTAYFMRTGSYTIVPPKRMKWPMRTKDGKPRPVSCRKTTPFYQQDDERTRRRILYGF